MVISNRFPIAIQVIGTQERGDGTIKNCIDC